MIDATDGRIDTLYYKKKLIKRDYQVYNIGCDLIEHDYISYFKINT